MFNDYRKLIQLYGNTKNKNEIATIMRCKWETVRDAIRRLEDVWGSLDSIPRNLSNEDIARALRNSSSKTLCLDLGSTAFKRHTSRSMLIFSLHLPIPQLSETCFFRPTEENQ